jgi:hypothetical protein
MSANPNGAGAVCKTELESSTLSVDSMEALKGVIDRLENGEAREGVCVRVALLPPYGIMP